MCNVCLCFCLCIIHRYLCPVSYAFLVAFHLWQKFLLFGFCSESSGHLLSCKFFNGKQLFQAGALQTLETVRCDWFASLAFQRKRKKGIPLSTVCLFVNLRGRVDKKRECLSVDKKCCPVIIPRTPGAAERAGRNF